MPRSTLPTLYPAHPLPTTPCLTSCAPAPTLLQLGLELTLVLRALSYSSPEEALDDLTALYNKAAALATLPAKAAEALQSGSGGTQSAGSGTVVVQRRPSEAQMSKSN